MLLTLTNPVENVAHVSLAICEDDDPDGINRTAQVPSLGSSSGRFLIKILFPEFISKGDFYFHTITTILFETKMIFYYIFLENIIEHFFSLQLTCIQV